MNELYRKKEKHLQTNRTLLYTYFAILIPIQTGGLFILFHNLNFYSALIAAMGLGFLCPILFGLVFIKFAKRLEEDLANL